MPNFNIKRKVALAKNDIYVITDLGNNAPSEALYHMYIYYVD